MRWSSGGGARRPALARFWRLGVSPWWRREGASGPSRPAVAGALCGGPCRGWLATDRAILGRPFDALLAAAVALRVPPTPFSWWLRLPHGRAGRLQSTAGASPRRGLGDWEASRRWGALGRRALGGEALVGDAMR